jgi:hypothetical protein
MHMKRLSLTDSQGSVAALGDRQKSAKSGYRQVTVGAGLLAMAAGQVLNY